MVGWPSTLFFYRGPTTADTLSRSRTSNSASGHPAIDTVETFALQTCDWCVWRLNSAMISFAFCPFSPKVVTTHSLTFPLFFPFSFLIFFSHFVTILPPPHFAGELAVGHFPIPLPSQRDLSSYLPLCHPHVCLCVCVRFIFPTVHNTRAAYTTTKPLKFIFDFSQTRWLTYRIRPICLKFDPFFICVVVFFGTIQSSVQLFSPTWLLAQSTRRGPTTARKAMTKNLE